ncbi:MAG: ATP-binding protein [Prevotellaceae bacterium]|jgi:hypothetical protein|nr:ATP-binding protein [Prevotellaceae bacterium]
MENPFLFGTATKHEWFIDRESDTERLSTNFRNGVNSILISPRRWGKTSLVHKVADIVQDTAIKVVVMDMFSCKTEKDFYTIFATQIIKQTASRWEEWVENAKQFLSAVTPKFSFGADPMNEFAISIDFSNKQLNEEILKLPQKIADEKGIKIVVCIDEFQQIAEIGDSITFQKKLRSVWQLQDVTYCLYGSKKHLLNAIFSKQSMPFYKFGDVIFLQKIDAIHWIPYICNQFAKTGKNISEKLAQRICQTVENHSSYVQQFAWLVWLRTEQTADETAFEQALQDLLDQNSMLFYAYSEGLTALQLNFLRALANDVNSQFSHKEILQKYDLGASANIARVKKALENKELVDISRNIIIFNDPVFKIWFKKEFLI